jgi:hypothetical protein
MSHQWKKLRESEENDGGKERNEKKKNSKEEINIENEEKENI